MKLAAFYDFKDNFGKAIEEADELGDDICIESFIDRLNELYMDFEELLDDAANEE